MKKHCIIVSALALMPGIIFGADLSELQGKSVHQALDLLGALFNDYYGDESDSDNGDQDDQDDQDEAQDQYYEDSSDYSEAQEQSYEDSSQYDATQEEFFFGNNSYSADDQGSWEEYYDSEEWREEYGDDGELADRANVPDEFAFSTQVHAKKRAQDFRKDRSYHNEYREELGSKPSQEQLGKRARRAAFEAATREDLTGKISIRKAKRLVIERSESRRQDKMHKALNLVHKRAHKQAERERKAAENEQKAATEIPMEKEVKLKKNAKNVGDKANSWQPNAPEVIFEKRLHDAHRQYRALVTKQAIKGGKQKQFTERKVKQPKDASLVLRSKDCEFHIPSKHEQSHQWWR